MSSEFDLINTYFRRPLRHTLLGGGDDGALVQPTPHKALVVSTDMLVEGTHFSADDDPEALGWKTLAVNLSDMAAMGAQARWALLALALPNTNAENIDWIAAFAHGFYDCADRFFIDVIGGDTTRGPRNFCVTIFGEAAVSQTLLRSGAKAGDDIWVSGTPGLAALALAAKRGTTTLTSDWLDCCKKALHRPQPRLELGQALCGIANAAIDVSDGLAADLGHILTASAVDAHVSLQALPQAAFLACPDSDLARDCLLAGGDDYELIFTAAPSQHPKIIALAAQLSLPLTRIGVITAAHNHQGGMLHLIDADGQKMTLARRGFDHFAHKAQ